MLGRLRGPVVERSEEGVIIETNGIGWEVKVPSSALPRLPHPPREAILYIHTEVGEYFAVRLYGFLTMEDRALFRLLLEVPSIGPTLAFSILSHFDAESFRLALLQKDRKVLQQVPGIGPKLAERLLTLQRKLLPLSADQSQGNSVSLSSGGAPSALAPSLTEVLRALVSMGFRPEEAQQAVARIAPHAQGKTLPELIKEALASMTI
ncbi:MAG: Holliday junction branch migration protein RuvA [Sandaracinaceae bacterium]|nr:Holliday junction branch migration protein RuvA [Sandaracinaceae bacterium]MDW8247484.1 Holliday junction branch migration protein RuvA [Sandaracinaceae bacterium]